MSRTVDRSNKSACVSCNTISPVYGYEHFGGIYCLHCQGRSEYGQGVGELHRKSGRGQMIEYKVIGPI
jgi:hypothetical protein